MMIFEPPSFLLSIVIASSHSTEAIGRFLKSARIPSNTERIDGDDAHIEWIIAYDPQTIEPATATAVMNADAVWVAGEPGALAARLRYWGFTQSKGQTIIFTEDSCEAGPNWLTAWLGACQNLVAATGSVRRSETMAPHDIAVFLCEYADFVDPAERLAGNNFALSRARAASLARSGEIRETAGLEVGERPLILPGAAIRHSRSYRIGEAIVDRCRFGWDYGTLRSRGRSWCYRLAGFLALPAIAAAQFKRIVISSRRGKSRDWLKPRVLPWLLIMIACWSVGEWLGWSFGRSRGSASKPLT